MKLSHQEKMARLDQRDRKLLRDIWLATTNALFKQAHGHTDGWDAVQKALDKAEDIMGEPEDYEI